MKKFFAKYKELLLIILASVIVICLVSVAIGLIHFYSHSSIHTIETEPAYLFTSLIVPDKMDKIKNEEFVYKDGFFKTKFTIMESDIDKAKHWALAPENKKIIIADYTLVYSMKEWVRSAGEFQYYWCFLRYYTEAFYLEAYIECNNPRNEEKLINSINAFIEHMNSHLS